MIPTLVPAVIPTTPPSTPPTSNTLIFERDASAAECFKAELLKRQSELKTFGAALLPAGSSWAMKTAANGWDQFWSDETWQLCSVKWGWCLSGLKWDVAEKVATKDVALAGATFYGTGTSLPESCISTSKP
jgi:hypothetical protein